MAVWLRKPVLALQERKPIDVIASGTTAGRQAGLRLDLVGR
jgi:uncharacterized protein (DUF2384 family)